MPVTRGFLLSCCTAGLIFAQASPPGQLTARELFYAAPQTPAAAKSPTAKTDARPPARRVPPPAKPVEIARADAPRPATAPLPATGAPPLGLRYTVLKLAADNTPTEVPNDTVFHAGDRIRFSVETNAPGYLYIVNQGSSGTWKPMFPSAEIDDGNNRIEGWRPYTMPPKSRFAFDSTAGTENLFIVFSLQPEPDLEGMIYSLQGKKKAVAAARSARPILQRADHRRQYLQHRRGSHARLLLPRPHHREGGSHHARR